MFVMHLSTMTMLLPLAQIPIQDGGAGMKSMLWDINFTLNGAGHAILMLPRGVQHMRASGVSLSFHHTSHHPLTLAAGRLVLVCLLLLLLCVVVCFLFCKCHGNFSILRAF